VRTAGLLLAAGGGTRFLGSGHKLLTPVRGRPLVVHAVGNMTAAHLDGAAVVTGAADLVGLLPAGVTRVTNPDWAQGQATSLAAGIRWADGEGFDAVVVGLGDQPGIGPEAWRAVAAATATPIAVAVYGGRRGHPVRLHRDVWDRLPVSGDAGARLLMAEDPALVTEVACDGDPMDVDTVEDLARW
jgi:molybdenum cofactor cytidylyltransferase